MAGNKRTKGGVPAQAHHTGAERGALAIQLIFFTVVVFLVVVVRARLLAMPLDRDEGEYAYVAQQWLQGVPPYKSIYHMKLPGMYMIYATILATLGGTPWAIHVGLLVCVLLSMALMVVVGDRILGKGWGWVAGGVFGLLSTSTSVQGTSANAEHFVLLFVIAGARVLLCGSGARWLRLGACGLLFGCAFVIKQQAALFGVFALVAVVSDGWLARDGNRRIAIDALLFLVGAALPFLVTCLWFAHLGLFHRMWWWTIVFPQYYGEDLSIMDGWQRLVQGAGPAVFTSGAIYLLAVLGCFRLGHFAKHLRVLLLAWAAASLLILVPGFQFFPHYFLFLAPVTALLSVVGARYMWVVRPTPGWATYGAVVLSALLIPLTEGGRFFLDTPEQVSRTMFGNNPFVESAGIARYIEARSAPDDRVAVFGSEPQLLFLAHRRSATGFLYMYEMFRAHPFALKFQKRMIMECRRARPLFAVFVHVAPSWISGRVPERMSYVEKRALEWINAEYHQVGMVNIDARPGRRSMFCWEHDGRACPAGPNAWIGIYRRNEPRPQP